MPSLRLLPVFAFLASAAFSPLFADPIFPKLPNEEGMKAADTDVWKPVPTVITVPADGIPSDAIVLFDGSSLNAWASYKDEKVAAPWKIMAGALVVAPGTGDIRTKKSFGDIQLHLEFCEPVPAVGKSQDRGNSGIFFMGLYELQVLDSYDNATYVNGQAGALYKQFPPLVNASRHPGEWQTYDAVWIAPRFDSDGKLLSPAHLTVFHNGVLVQHDITVRGQTRNVGHPIYVAHPPKLPLVLQDHHHAVGFRNIWVRELTMPEAK